MADLTFFRAPRPNQVAHFVTHNAIMTLSMLLLMKLYMTQWKEPEKAMEHHHMQQTSLWKQFPVMFVIMCISDLWAKAMIAGSIAGSIAGYRRLFVAPTEYQEQNDHAVTP